MEKDTRSIEAQISEEHRRLAPLFERLREALGEDDPVAVRLRFDELETELERHLGQEDQLYYPALSALRPVHRETLTHFVTDHDRFRSELEAISRWVAAGEIPRAHACFETLARGFATHEVHEEQFLRGLEAEFGSAAAVDPLR
jgi:iron-sulfur cluster repair protein YtfE (RIC family)